MTQVPEIATTEFHSNPFSTRFVRPDHTAYRFAGGGDAEDIAARVLATLTTHGAAAIVGPHGTGKSTLLHTLLPSLQQRFSPVNLIRLSSATDAAAELARWQRGMQDGVSAEGQPPLSTDAGRCWVIDGFEQLGRLTRGRLIWQARQRFRTEHRGRRPRRPCLLVTAHRDQFGAATVHRTGWDEALVRRMTEEKLAGLPEPHRRAMLKAAERQAIEMYRRRPADRNVRDYWFTLYDEYERLRWRRSFAAGLPRRTP